MPLAARAKLIEISGKAVENRAKKGKERGRSSIREKLSPESSWAAFLCRWESGVRNRYDGEKRFLTLRQESSGRGEKMKHL
jgi:hypothetical protein